MIAAIYVRKSTEQHGVADEQKSVTRQIEHASEYAGGKGWMVARSGRGPDSNEGTVTSLTSGRSCRTAGP